MKQLLDKFFYILLVCLTTSTINVNGQVISNQGTTFWIAFPTHVPDFNAQFIPLPAQISIFITGSRASAGKVSAGSFSQTFTVTPKQVTEVKVPRDAAYINDTESGQVLSNRAIQVVVDAGQPAVAVYAHIFAGQRSAASLILPSESLGRQYYSMNFQEHDTEGQNYITLVATEPNTTLHIKKGNTELVPGGVTLSKVNDIYEYLSTQDLSGVTVTSADCQHFAMFSGSTGVYISPASCTPHSLDPLFQQCYAIENWGNEYGYIPFSTFSPNFPNPVRTAGQLIRVMAKEPGTVVQIDGVPVATLSAGEYYTSPQPLAAPAHIKASKPVMVAQFALSQACSNINNLNYGYSDPDMVFLNPINYSINDITVYSSTRENITEQYVNVLIPAAAAPGFKINGHAPAGTFTTMDKFPGYAYLQLNLNKDSANTFRLTAPEGFNAIAYGFGNVESYSYAAGTNLTGSQSIYAIRTTSGLKTDSACVNDDYYFRLILPYKSPRISWKMDKDELPVIQNNPPAVQQDQNGVPVYVYQLPKTPAYQQPGNHIIEITADYPADLQNCGNGQQVIKGAFKVLPLPAVSFTMHLQNCGLSANFSDTSDPENTISRLWNFGDPNSADNNTSNLKDPVHFFKDLGTYNVQLTITSKLGCQATYTDQLIINRKMTPKFTTSMPSCEGKPVLFTDKSEVYDFVIGEHKWYFGDGDSSSTAGGTIQHIYKTPGNYTAKLLLISTEGCKSDTLSQAITIHARPIPAFLTPDICITDADAQFQDQSTLPDGDQAAVTYLWNFDDPHASANNPNTSTLKNSHHHFSEAKIYNISLTITSAAGCDITLQKQFIVNGVQPKADFEIPGSGPTCSGSPIQIRNLSSVLDFGSITRLVWHFDEGKNEADTLAVAYPQQGQIFSHTYPAFYGAGQHQTHTIKLFVYSGKSCADFLAKEITLLPAPKLQFDQLPDICLNADPVQLTQAREISGLNSSETHFTGEGISAQGTFNPAVAGQGQHTITYHFTSVSGCETSISRSINVLQPPKVNAEANILVLQGNSILLKPHYEGSGLTYQWSPATGLDNANSPTPLASPVVTTTYKVTVSNGACAQSANILVTVLHPPEIFNTFTPNGDGNNDLWSIPHLQDYPKAQVTIFNRYGAQLYYSSGYYQPWDGKFAGKDVPVGTYYYIIKPGNGQKNFSGFVTVIR